MVLATVTLCCASHTTIYPCPPFGLARLPHSTACDMYIQCFAGEAVERSCGSGLHYNVTAEKCMDQNIAECTRTQCPLFNDPSHLVYFPDYLECDKYYLCHDNELRAFRCADGLHWDEEREYCTSPAEAECKDYEIFCDATGVHNVPNPRFCDQFYYCLNGNSFPSVCPGELIFDTVTNRCNYAGDAVCYEGSLLP